MFTMSHNMHSIVTKKIIKAYNAPFIYIYTYKYIHTYIYTKMHGHIHTYIYAYI